MGEQGARGMLMGMSTTRIRAARAIVGAVALACTAAACGSSSPAATPASSTIPADCATLSTKFNAAITGFGTSSTPGIAAVFTELDGVLPTDLKDDAKVLAATFAEFDAVVTKYNGDLAKAAADPAGQAAIVKLGSEKDAAANAALHHYFAIGCTQN
jgi:hypothetical protein